MASGPVHIDPRAFSCARSASSRASLDSSKRPRRASSSARPASAAPAVTPLIAASIAMASAASASSQRPSRSRRSAWSRGEQGGQRADALLDRAQRALAREIGRLLDAPGPVEGLAEVDVGARDLLDVVALAGDAHGLVAVLDPGFQRAGVAQRGAHRAEDAALLAARAGGARDLQRRLAERERLGSAPEQQEQVALGAEHAGTARGVAVLRQAGDRGAAARPAPRASSR